jgi:hypothetical protein
MKTFTKQEMKVAVLTTLVFAAVAPAHAAIIQLTNESQIATSFVNDFESVVNAGPVTFDVGDQRGFAGGASSGVTTSGSYGLLSNGFPIPITATLSGSYNAVGLYFGNDDTCCSRGFSAVLSVFSGATALGSVSVQANMNDYVDQFIGLSSDTPFDRVTIDYGNAGLYTYIDDFRLGSANVPEPTSLALFGLGLSGLGFSRRKQS